MNCLNALQSRLLIELISDRYCLDAHPYNLTNESGYVLIIAFRIG